MRPRRYGLHATLKAPFRLAPGRSEAGLLSAVEALAGRIEAVKLRHLSVSQIGRFLALTPDRAPGLDGLAARLVQELDVFRAPLTGAEIARRHKAGLSAMEAELMRRWGYPYVMEAFRFHVTLTGPLDDWVRERTSEVLAKHLDGVLGAETWLDRVAVCAEDDAGRFVVSRFADLGGDRRG